jgi:hypothetical protein
MTRGDGADLAQCVTHRSSSALGALVRYDCGGLLTSVYWAKAAMSFYQEARTCVRLAWGLLYSVSHFHLLVDFQRLLKRTINGEIIRPFRLELWLSILPLA